MTPNEMIQEARHISYKPGWEIYVNGLERYLQVVLPGKEWRGRKWRLSEHMTKSEFIQTALLAFLSAEEHEAREAFKYRGRPIFYPHWDVDRLVEMYDVFAPALRKTNEGK